MADKFGPNFKLWIIIYVNVHHPIPVAPSTFIVNITDEEKDMGLRVESDATR